MKVVARADRIGMCEAIHEVIEHELLKESNVV